MEKRQRAGCILPEPDPVSIVAHRLSPEPDAFGQNLARPCRSDPNRFYTKRCRPSSEKSDPEPVLHKTMQAFFREVGSGTGFTQNDAGLLQRSRIRNRFYTKRCRPSSEKSDPEPVLHKTMQAFFREVGSSMYDPARFWLHAGRKYYCLSPSRVSHREGHWCDAFGFVRSCSVSNSSTP